MSERFYSMYACGEMERLQTEGRRMGMGSLNAIVFSCGTVTIYLTGVDVQRRLAVPTESKLPLSFCQLSCTCPSLIGTLA